MKMRTIFVISVFASFTVGATASAESFHERRTRIAALPICSTERLAQVDGVKSRPVPEGKMIVNTPQGSGDSNPKRVRIEMARKREDRAAALGCRIPVKQGAADVKPRATPGAS